jgi:hypothetical protein
MNNSKFILIFREFQTTARLPASFGLIIIPPLREFQTALNDRPTSRFFELNNYLAT